MAVEHEGMGSGRSGAETAGGGIAHKRVHWRSLVVNAGEKHLPGHIIEISDGNASFLSRYSFPVGTTVNLVVFVPESQDRSKFAATSLSGKVSFQIIRDDQIQTGLSLKLDSTTRQSIRSALRNEP
jgi:hypothetical protein